METSQPPFTPSTRARRHTHAAIGRARADILTSNSRKCKTDFLDSDTAAAYDTLNERDGAKTLRPEASPRKVPKALWQNETR